MATPRYVVLSTGERMGLYRIAQLNERGFYEVVLEMKRPYNHHEAATKLCENLNSANLKLLPEVALPTSQLAPVSGVV
jgi:hypothetical protein